MASRTLFAYEHNLTEVLMARAKDFEDKIAAELGPDFLDDIAHRRFTQILTAEEFDKFDDVLSEVLEIPSAKQAQGGQALETRKTYLAPIVHALEELTPEIGKIIDRYKLELQSDRNEPFSYRSYAEGLINAKKKGNPRLYEKFHQRLRDEIENSETQSWMEGVESESMLGEWEPAEPEIDVRGIVNEGLQYYLEMPEVQRKWLEFAEKHIEKAFGQGRSARQVVTGLRDMLNAFKRSMPNEVLQKSLYARLRRLRRLAEREWKPGDRIRHGRFYGIVLRLGGKKNGRRIYEALLVGPPQDQPGVELGETTGWQVPVFAEALEPFPFEPTQKEQAIIDDWQQWAARQAGHVMPRQPIKRNYDYTGNYLDRVKKLQKKKRKATTKRLRVIAGRLKKKAVKEYFDEQEMMELLSTGLPDLKVEYMPGQERDFAGTEKKELPFAYGEIPNYINSADDMGWDVIILPSTWGCTRDELMPVGILRYNRDVNYWNTLPGDDPIGNDKILLGKRSKNSTGDPRGEYTKEDLDVLHEHFKDTEAFESPELIWDYA